MDLEQGRSIGRTSRLSGLLSLGSPLVILRFRVKTKAGFTHGGARVKHGAQRRVTLLAYFREGVQV